MMYHQETLGFKLAFREAQKVTIVQKKTNMGVLKTCTSEDDNLIKLHF